MSFVISFFFGFSIGSRGSVFSSVFLLVLSAAAAWILFFKSLASGGSLIIIFSFGEWFSLGGIRLEWEFIFDSLSILMLTVVLTISTLVHVFSCDYMRFDPYKVKFMSFLSLFTFFMVVLVLSNNFLVLFIGWEGVGICSYLLISFWDTRVQCIKSANKALIINKIGDFFLLVAIAAVIHVFKSLDFYIVLSCAHQYVGKTLNVFGFDVHALSFISLFLFLAAAAKSAQIFLHTWLPDAMEGPTPVSALIHAATMVTAGVFLIIRCSFIIDFSPSVLLLMTYAGAFTLVVSGLIALFQNDIKKIVAYSTCSQLGYMVFACGLSGYHLAFFHLFNHAFFKALLFLASGVVIHALGGEQDIRRMGGLSKLMPFTYSCVLVASLSLMGAPFLSGFFSKDAILELAYAKLCEDHFHLYVFSLIGVMLTVLYSLRLLFFVFVSRNKSYKSVIKGVEENTSFLIIVPFVFLTFCSIFSGFLYFNLFTSESFSFFQDSIFVNHANRTPALVMPGVVSYFPLLLSFVSFSGFYISLVLPLVRVLYSDGFMRNSYLKNYELFYATFNKKLFIDDFYNIFAYAVYRFSYALFANLDKGALETLGPRGVSSFIYKAALSFNKSSQSGYLYNYGLVLAVNVFLICFFVFLAV